MKVCPKCGFEDNPQWRHSRFDFNADYMLFEEAKDDRELEAVYAFLKDKGNFIPYETYAPRPYIFYRRGTGGLYLYRCLKEDFRVPRERKKH